MWLPAVGLGRDPTGSVEKERLSTTIGATNRSNCRLRSLEDVLGAFVIRVALERTWQLLT